MGLQLAVLEFHAVQHRAQRQLVSLQLTLPLRRGAVALQAQLGLGRATHAPARRRQQRPHAQLRQLGVELARQRRVLGPVPALARGAQLGGNIRIHLAGALGIPTQPRLQGHGTVGRGVGAQAQRGFAQTGGHGFTTVQRQAQIAAAALQAGLQAHRRAGAARPQQRPIAIKAHLAGQAAGVQRLRPGTEQRGQPFQRKRAQASAAVQAFGVPQQLGPGQLQRGQRRCRLCIRRHDRCAVQRQAGRQQFHLVRRPAQLQRGVGLQRPDLGGVLQPERQRIQHQAAGAAVGQAGPAPATQAGAPGSALGRTVQAQRQRGRQALGRQLQRAEQQRRRAFAVVQPQILHTELGQSEPRRQRPGLALPVQRQRGTARYLPVRQQRQQRLWQHRPQALQPGRAAGRIVQHQVQRGRRAEQAERVLRHGLGQRQLAFEIGMAAGELQRCIAGKTGARKQPVALRLQAGLRRVQAQRVQPHTVRLPNAIGAQFAQRQAL